MRCARHSPGGAVMTYTVHQVRPSGGCCQGNVSGSEQSILDPRDGRGSKVTFRILHSKHETLAQCFFNVGPASQTVVQH